MKKLISLLLFAVVSVVLFGGCGPGSAKVTAANKKAFDSATPELQRKWAQVQAAGATNDYVQAIVTRLTATGQVVNPGTAAEFGAAIEAQRKQAAEVGKLLGIKPAQ